MRLRDGCRFYLLMFLVGGLAGSVCRLSDFFPYDSLWGLSSIATLFGFWIASVGVITYLSVSNIGAFMNTFLYMFGMTCSFYGLKYLLGFFIPLFSNDGRFQMELFLVYSVLAVVCGVGSFVLYFLNRKDWVGAVLCALPASGMLAEAVGCLLVLFNKRMLLGQTIFDFVFALGFGILFFKRAGHKVLYMVTMVVVTVVVYGVVYRPYLPV